MSSSGAALQPTFTGHVATTQDALILFEGCLQGHLSHVPRRPHDRERSTLIRSGSVFIYEENASGIKRWTDGVTWSPSRILGNFLVYRELDKPFPPGEKKRALKKPNRRPSRPGEPYPAPASRSTDYTPSSPTGSFGNNNERQPTEAERQLIGSLIDSYGFKAGGLVKKTMSVTVQGVTHHLVSYYNVEDVMSSALRTPSSTETLQYIRPRPELTSKQSFRSPIDDAEDVSEISGSGAYSHRMGYGGYDYGKQQNPMYYGSQQYAEDVSEISGSGAYGHRMGGYGGYDYGKQQNPMYYGSQQYPPMTGQAPLQQYPGSIPSINTGYLSNSLGGSSLGQDRQQYSPYDQSSYGRSMPPNPSSSIPTSMADRGQPSMYPPSSMSRPMTTLSPVTMDNRSSMSYRSSNYSIPPITSPTSAQRPQQQQQQQSPISMKYEDRREQHQTPVTPSFPSSAPYYNSNQMTGTWNAPAQQ